MPFKDTYLERMAKRSLSSSGNLTILLADDDQAESLHFKEALERIRFNCRLNTRVDGEELTRQFHQPNYFSEF
jgi:hypothetical protein